MTLEFYSSDDVISPTDQASNYSNSTLNYDVNHTPYTSDLHHDPLATLLSINKDYGNTELGMINGRHASQEELHRHLEVMVDPTVFIHIDASGDGASQDIDLSHWGHSQNSSSQSQYPSSQDTGYASKFEDSYSQSQPKSQEMFRTSGDPADILNYSPLVQEHREFPRHTRMDFDTEGLKIRLGGELAVPSEGHQSYDHFLHNRKEDSQQLKRSHDPLKTTPNSYGSHDDHYGCFGSLSSHDSFTPGQPYPPHHLATGPRGMDYLVSRQVVEKKDEQEVGLQLKSESIGNFTPPLPPLLPPENRNRPEKTETDQRE